MLLKHILFIVLPACCNSNTLGGAGVENKISEWTSSLITADNVSQHNNKKNTAALNYLDGINAYSLDSLVQVVIEIPAGCNQKWEVDKKTGQLAWETVTPDSFRVVNYLPYPANYGFVPQTLVSTETGGDGDPVDIFILGTALKRGEIVQVKPIGLINMIDNGEHDSKLLAVPISGGPFVGLTTLEELKTAYPGVLEIITLWLTNYKGPNKVSIDSTTNKTTAHAFVKNAHSTYKQLKNK